MITSIAAVFALTAFAIWRAYWTPFVAAEPPVVGEPIAVEGRILSLKVPGYLTVKAIRRNKEGKPVIYQEASVMPVSAGLGRYSFQKDLSPLRMDGEFELQVWGWGRQLQPTAKLRVKPAPEQSNRL